MRIDFDVEIEKKLKKDLFSKSEILEILEKKMAKVFHVLSPIQKSMQNRN